MIWLVVMSILFTHISGNRRFPDLNVCSLKFHWFGQYGQLQAVGNAHDSKVIRCQPPPVVFHLRL
jgi:hypothetical protein